MTEQPEPRAPLRVAILIDTWQQPAWVARMLERIQSSPSSHVVLVVKNAAPAMTQKRSLAQLASKRRHLLYSIYAKLEARRVRGNADAFRMVDIRPLVADAAVLDVVPIQKKFSDYFGDDDIRTIESHRLDVAMRLDFRILRGKALAIARYGVWSYHHGDNRTNRGGPACLWEVAHGVPVTGSVLQVLGESLDAGRVLVRSWSATDRQSLQRSRNNLYWKTAEFVPRQLDAVARDGDAAMTATAGDYAPYSAPLYRIPTNGELLAPLVRIASDIASNKLRDLVSREQWFIAYRFRTSPADGNDELFRFRHFMPPPDRSWADPFPFEHGGKMYLFLEEQRFGERGHLSVCERDGDGWTTPRRVLERPYHLSYPFVFRWRDEIYMVPETRQNRTVDLYRAAQFPDRWEPCATLLANVNGADATLHEHEGRWWMFVTIAAEGALCTDELFLFHADSPLGPWMPHRRNPVRSDVRVGRSAGRLFAHNGRLYRPAQDGSRRYGHSIRIQRVDVMTPDAYEESESSVILPEWTKGLLATHTLNFAGDLAVVDGLHRRSKWSARR
jgi:hypothetical protein